MRPQYWIVQTERGHVVTIDGKPFNSEIMILFAASEHRYKVSRSIWRSLGMPSREEPTRGRIK